VVAISSALEGRASLAFSNALGGIAAQTAFLAVADMVYRKANLEHASADIATLLQAAWLILMLSLSVLAFAGPNVSAFGVHPVSVLLPIVYIIGLKISAQARSQPMWNPVHTTDTRKDVQEQESEDGASLTNLLLRFLGLAIALGTAGWIIAKTGGIIADRSGISETVVGALMTAVATSLPELVTTLAAVRRGAVQLAVGGIIGGNTFDVLFLTLSDFSYRSGSIYHAIDVGDLFWIGMALVMSVVLLIGLIVRERRGPGGIGLESSTILALYLSGVAVQTLLL
jgi:cation:H+ antiporter